MPHIHVVDDGDCLESIAFRYGLRPQTIWEHSDNEALRALRASPHVLRPGDKVYVPDLRRKDVAAQTGARHRFRRCSVPAKLRLRFDDAGEARAGIAYTLSIDGGAPLDGSTDGDGRLEQWLPPDAQNGVPVLESGEAYALRFGTLRPDDRGDGICARLANLGYGEIADDISLEAALLTFQHDQKLEETGIADEATLARLRQVHGS